MGKWLRYGCMQDVCAPAPPPADVQCMRARGTHLRTHLSSVDCFSSWAMTLACRALRSSHTSSQSMSAHLSLRRSTESMIAAARIVLRYSSRSQL